MSSQNERNNLEYHEIKQSEIVQSSEQLKNQLVIYSKQKEEKEDKQHKQYDLSNLYKISVTSVISYGIVKSFGVVSAGSILAIFIGSGVVVFAMYELGKNFLHNLDNNDKIQKADQKYKDSLTFLKLNKNSTQEEIIRQKEFNMKAFNPDRFSKNYKEAALHQQKLTIESYNIIKEHRIFMNQWKD